MFAEIVYETGRMSVGQYDSEGELKSALKAHNDRAKAGEPGGPVGQPAERIAAVYTYDSHPDGYNVEQTASADVVEKEVAELVKKMKDKNGVVAIDALSLAVRDLSHPMKQGTDRADAFSSFYKTKEQGSLNLDFLEGDK